MNLEGGEICCIWIEEVTVKIPWGDKENEKEQKNKKSEFWSHPLGAIHKEKNYNS